jgi:hypothetical protein
MVVAIPEKLSHTAASAVLVVDGDAATSGAVVLVEQDDPFIEESMDYSGVEEHELVAPDFPDEEWPAGGTGPAGF